ncbi:MAG TPA: hypothetical protein VN429_11505, partial [Methanospirillum sp.]|uniref:hypothetical protein n=1 Tax=Methanospirillum sp. TaxID=45200 RepID=UPI002CE929F8
MRQFCYFSAILLAMFIIIGCAICSASLDNFPGASSTGMPPDQEGIGNGQPPSGMPPGGTPSAGAPPGGPGGNQGTSFALTGNFTVDDKTVSASDGNYMSDKTDTSAIYVTNKGSLTLTNPIISTTGNTSNNDASSFYGLNGAVLANNASTVKISGGTITSTGTGANGAIPTGEGTSISLDNLTITASGNGGHGVMATLGGTLTLVDVNVITSGKNGAPIATDRGSGTVTVTRGTISSSGIDSPGLYSTGVINVTDAIVKSVGTEAAVIEGFNTIHLVNTSLSGGVEKTGGIMIYQSFSGDAETGTGTFTMDGGSYEPIAGPAFFVTNTDSVITLKNVKIVGAPDLLIKAAGTSRWGTQGKNGGIVNFNADNVQLIGSLETDAISSISATLKNGSTLSGAINTSAISLDGTSSWNVTADSTLTSLKDSAGIVDGSIVNIIGNGFT